MIRKKKKRAIYSIGQKNFNTFKAMKAFIWHNSHINEEQNDFIITVGQHLATEQHFATREEAYRDWETDRKSVV